MGAARRTRAVREVGLLWDCYGIAMGLLWDCYGVAMGWIRGCDGVAMGWTRGCVGILIACTRSLVARGCNLVGDDIYSISILFGSGGGTGGDCSRQRGGGCSSKRKRKDFSANAAPHGSVPRTNSVRETSYRRGLKHACGQWTARTRDCGCSSLAALRHASCSRQSLPERERFAPSQSSASTPQPPSARTAASQPAMSATNTTSVLGAQAGASAATREGPRAQACAACHR